MMTLPQKSANGAAAKALSVGSLTELLKNGVKKDRRTNGRGYSTHIEKVLAMAAETEQRLEDQEVRIRDLEALLVTDELTGLLNRRGLFEHMKRAFSLADRQGGHGAIAFIDLDNFKTINDRFGHPGGDAVLKRVAEILLANTRASDVIARLGGDEFVVLLVPSVKQWCESRARQIQDAINSSFADYHAHSIPLRASLGTEMFRADARPEDLLSQADEAMYANKRERAKLVDLATAKLTMDREYGIAAAAGA